MEIARRWWIFSSGKKCKKLSNKSLMVCNY